MKTSYESLIGQKFNNWVVIGPCNGRQILCECQCKNKTTKMVGVYNLVNGLSKSCGHCSSVKYNIGDKVDHLTIIDKLSDFKYVCQCDCKDETILTMTSKDLKRKTSCGCDNGNNGKHANNFTDLTGQRFNDWKFIKHLEGNKWLVECSCGNTYIRESKSIINGASKSCGHKTTKFIDITGETNNEFKAIEYIGNKTWKCECLLCGKLKNIKRKSFKETSLVCNHKNTDGTLRIKQNRHKDYENKLFNSWQVLRYIGDSKWECQCIVCGKIKVIGTYALGHTELKCDHVNIAVGDMYNDWEVLGVFGNKIKCVCRCGCNNTISIVNRNDLISGKSKSCGLNTNAFKNIENQIFGNWKALEYVGNGYWKCECQCENHTIKYIHTYALRNGSSKSCGCMKKELNLVSRITEYNEINSNKAQNPRELWQIDVINDANKLEEYINTFKNISVTELSNLLSVNYSTILQRLKKFNLIHLVNLNELSSYKEKEVYNYITSIYKGKVVRNDRKVIKPYELDIYIPEYKLAIEFNGNYWHSEPIKGKDYHKNKTIACGKNGIRLIHIFEHEWDDDNKQNKLKNYLYNIVSPNYTKLYARNTEIKLIDYDISAKFLDKYHLQNSIKSSTVHIGCYYNDELIGVMTLGKPRFTNNYEYELHRLCWKNNVRVVGGTAKLFNYFIKEYEPDSVISYVDLSKFNGVSYTKLGFKLCIGAFTEPNYVWVKGTDVLTRYQTQKHKLLELELGTEDQTEDEIMKSYGYIKIYDSGNLKLEWIK